ncbi:MAG: QueT transporter family protein [Eubacteriaceae bacterium]|jgi:Predicted membrane protein|nr:QueT transporter family protein [Eubacteriaceae bacterium]
MKFRTKYLIQAAVIAAVYAVLTVILSPISYGPIQLRVSEALTILPAFTPAAVPGLFLGCLIANLMSPVGIIDIVCGSAASLAAAYCSYRLRNKPLLVPLPPVIANGVIIGLELHFLYTPEMPLPACMGWVALGELGACYAIGYPLYKLLEHYREIFR